MTLQIFLDCSDTYAPASVFLLYLWKRKDLPVHAIFIGIYLATAVIVFAYSNWLASSKTNNLFIYHFFAAFDYYLFCLYLYPLVGSKSKTIFIVASVLFTIFLATNIALWEPLGVFNTNSAIISSFLLIVFALIYYLNLIESDEIFDIKTSFSFWIITGVLLYSATCIFVNFFYKYDESISSSGDQLLWLIQDVATLLKYVLFSFGIIWYNKKPTYHGSLLY